MKIVFLVMRFGKDGLATNVLQLTQGLVEEGHELHIITSGYKIGTSADRSFFDDLDHQFQQLRVQLHKFQEPKGNPLKKGLMALRGFVQVRQYLVKLKPDVIHCHSPNMTFMPWLMRKKYVSTVHADTIRPNIRYKHPDLLIAVSSGAKEFTERVMGTDPKTIRMVHHGISERFSEEIPKVELERLKKEQGIPQDKTIIGFVGRITPMKGTDVLLNALGKYVSQSVKNEIHLVFVGDYQTENDKLWLKNLLAKNQLTDRLTMIPFCDPKPYYQLFDVFVLPSRSDTFGLVAVEAMMSGCCTIRSNSNGAVDQIDHGTDGLIFPMDDSQTLGKLLEEVLTDTAYREQLASQGKTKALGHFTHKKMVKNTLEVYNELITI